MNDATEPDDDIDALLPRNGDSPAEIERKFAEIARRLSLGPETPDTKALIFSIAWVAVKTLLDTGDHERAARAFQKVASMTGEASTLSPAQREEIADSAVQVAGSCVEPSDDATATAVFEFLQNVAERHPDDAKIVRAAATSANVVANIHATSGDEKTVAKAERFANAIIGLPRLPRQQDHDACMDDLARTLTVITRGYVRNECWKRAAILVWQVRQIIFAPFVHHAISEVRGDAQASEVHRMFCMLMQSYLQNAGPERDRGKFVTVLDHIDFEPTKRVRCWDAITLEVPRRWSAWFSDEGRWVVDEDAAKIESGTLWVDYDVISGTPPDFMPGAPDFEAALGQAASDYDMTPPETRDEAAIRPSPDGPLYYLRTRSIEGEEWLVVHSWRRFGRHGDQMVQVHFHLVILAFLAERDDFRALVPQIEASIGRAEINWATLVAKRLER